MRNILSSLACLAVCLLAWAAPAQAAETRVLVLPFAVNAPAAQQQLAGDIPTLVRQGLENYGVKAIPTSAGKARQQDAASARSRARSAKASYAVKVGDTIEITFGNRPVTVRVLAVEEPKGKDVARELFEVVSQPS